MSECVVRMKKHGNCLDCDLHQIVYGDSYADTDVYCFKEKRLVGKRFGPAKDLARPDWCPIVAASPWHRVEEEMPDLLQFVVVCNDEGKCVVAQYVGYQTDSLTSWRIAYTMYDTDIYDETECGPVCYWMPIEPPKEDA